jgi:hypothetical protein
LKKTIPAKPTPDSVRVPPPAVPKVLGDTLCTANRRSSTGVAVVSHNPNGCTDTVTAAEAVLLSADVRSLGDPRSSVHEMVNAFAVAGVRTTV